jgi:peptidoglycan/xylan/chitin deacetylase (PgdA/CDA1 family)
MYHHISPKPAANFRKYSITPARFASQMRWLAIRGYQTISVGTLLSFRSGEGPCPAQPIVITFDDGFQDTVEHAVPVLLRYGFTATFYVVAGLVGGRSRWLEAELGLSLPLFDWATARQLHSQGFTVGSHSMTHSRLDAAEAAALRREVSDSRRLLEDGLGTDVRDLAYPFGLYDQRVVDAAREAGYRSACSVRIGRSSNEDDPMALHRVPVAGHETFPTFLLRLRTGFNFAELVSSVRSGDAAGPSRS